MKSKTDHPAANKDITFITERIRSMCRDGVELAAPKIIAIANGEAEGANPQTQIRAFNSLAAQAMHEAPIQLDQGDWISLMIRVTAKYLPDRNTYNEWYKDCLEALHNA